jgi:hypothetical protein
MRSFDHDALGRLGPLAVIDIVGTLAVALAAALATGQPLVQSCAAALLLGEVVHLGLGVRTPVTLALGLAP